MPKQNYEQKQEISNNKQMDSYKRGVWGESITIEMLKEHGWNIYTSPASRGPADLVAIKAGSIWMIQVKVRANDFIFSLLPSEERDLLELSSSLNAQPVLARITTNAKHLLRIVGNSIDNLQPCIIRDTIGKMIAFNIGDGYTLSFINIKNGKILEP